MTLIEQNVDQIFAEAAPMPWHLCRNPVVGGEWLVGDDPIEPQKEVARRALLAREAFAIYGPPDAPPLPLSPIEQEALRYHDPLGHLVAEYARSLQANGWEFHKHPDFETFARGVLASTLSPDFTRDNAALLKRYPPHALVGMGPGQVWTPVH